MRPTGPGQAAHLLLDVVDVLNELCIPYALARALAASYYGIPRSTSDADSVVWLKDTGKTERDLTNRLLAGGYRAQLRRGDIDDPILGSIQVEDQHENQVDLLLGVRGMDPDAAGRCVSATLLDSSIRIIAAEDLIAMKIFAGGFQDLEDVRGILQVSGDLLNVNLLRKVARRHGADVNTKLDVILNEFPPTLPLAGK